jgi:hypothetical protein
MEGMGEGVSIRDEQACRRRTCSTRCRRGTGAGERGRWLRRGVGGGEGGRRRGTEIRKREMRGRGCFGCIYS